MRRQHLCVAGLLAALAWVTNARADLTEFKIGPGANPNGTAGFMNDTPAAGSNHDRLRRLRRVGKPPIAAATYTIRSRLRVISPPLFASSTSTIRHPIGAATASMCGKTSPPTIHRACSSIRRPARASRLAAPSCRLPKPKTPTARITMPRLAHKRPPRLPCGSALHRTGPFYVSQWAPDEGGSPGTFSAPHVQSAAAPNAGPMYVGLVHQRHTEGGDRNSTAVFDNFQVAISSLISFHLSPHDPRRCATGSGGRCGHLGNSRSPWSRRLG